MSILRSYRAEEVEAEKFANQRCASVGIMAEYKKPMDKSILVAIQDFVWLCAKYAFLQNSNELTVLAHVMFPEALDNNQSLRHNLNDFSQRKSFSLLGAVISSLNAPTDPDIARFQRVKTVFEQRSL